METTELKKGLLAVSEVEPVETLMSGLLARSQEPPKEGDIIEGTVIALDRARLYIDLPPFGTGVIYGREYMNAREVIKRTNVGDIIQAKVIATVTKDGYIELSLKEARQAVLWAEAEEAVKNKLQFELVIKEVSKGDKDKILDELRKLVGTKLTVSMIGAQPKEGKLIFSEKGLDDKEKRELIAAYQVNDVVEGEVTGMVDFGAFVKLEEGLEGLVHISEIDWGLVGDPRHFFKVGDKVKVKIIDIKDGKVSLSVKALKENPWQVASERYNKGDKVEGVVI